MATTFFHFLFYFLFPEYVKFNKIKYKVRRKFTFTKVIYYAKFDNYFLKISYSYVDVIKSIFFKKDFENLNFCLWYKDICITRVNLKHTYTSIFVNNYDIIFYSIQYLNDFISCLEQNVTSDNLLEICNQLIDIPSPEFIMFTFYYQNSYSIRFPSYSNVPFFGSVSDTESFHDLCVLIYDKFIYFNNFESLNNKDTVVKAMKVYQTLQTIYSKYSISVNRFSRPESGLVFLTCISYGSTDVSTNDFLILDLDNKTGILFINFWSDSYLFNVGFTSSSLPELVRLVMQYHAGVYLMINKSPIIENSEKPYFYSNFNSEFDYKFDKMDDSMLDIIQMMHLK